VFGPAPQGTAYKEWDRYDSHNPYAATKAAGEELALSFANTYNVPIMVIHTMNMIGERQHPEKFVPSTIRKLLHDETVTIHTSPDGVPGSRFYIHCRNVADALLFLLRRGERCARDKFNIVGELEIDNYALASFIAEVMGKELKYEFVDFHSSRPGHDLRYALDGAKLREMGWEPPKMFFESLEKTIKWTLDNPRWLNL
jgi:dTDP-glucose 4,6-dehydratase